MSRLKIVKPAVAVFIAILGGSLVGCGSSSNDEKVVPPAVTTQSISGVVSDPAIAGANVMVYDAQGQQTAFTAITDENGLFSISGLPAGELTNYRLVSQGGIDKSTGQRFTKIELATPIDVFTEKDQLVISPITSLIDAKINDGVAASEVVEQVKAMLAEVDLLADPSNDKVTQRLSMKLSMLLAQGFDASSIVASLDNEAGISESDISALFKTEKAESKARLWQGFQQLTLADSKEKQVVVYQTTTALGVLFDASGIQLSSDEVLADNVMSNVYLLAEHFYQIAQSKTDKYISSADIVASLAHYGGISIDMLASEDFSVEHFALVAIADENAEFSDSLKLAFYTLKNPVTGNDQLVVHDTETNQQQVIKTDVILGNRAFIFNGEKDGDKTIFKSHEYGLFLDPSQEHEKRSAPNGYGGLFEYSFYLNNVFKAYDVSKPTDERVIFSNDNFSEQLTSQGIAVLDNSYRVVDNLTDITNSYVELTAYEKLADVFKNEISSDINHVPLAVRLSDGAYTQGHITALLKDEEGKSANVLVSYEAVHKSGSYPSSEAERKRLQICQTDLSSCDDITAAGDVGDGGFFFRSESSTHIYLNKQGSELYFAYDKAKGSLHQVTGVKFPASFDSKHHLVGAGGHGGSGILNNFSSLPSVTTNLSEGENAYLAVNYDLDTKDALGSYKYLGKVFTFKNAQVIKFNGINGVKMFDSGDGIDLGDDSDAKKANGHINLVAALKGKLFVEMGNYDATSAGGDCEVNSSGYYCSSVVYGYLKQDSVAKTSFDGEIARKDNLKFMIARRLPPYAINGDLYLNLLHEEGGRGVGHQYTLYRYDIDSLQLISEVQGRSYFTLSAKYDDGRMEGQVIAWDATTNKLVNVTTGKIIVADLASSIEGDTAINSVFANSNGLPLAGLGDIFALRADPGDHQWYLQAGSLAGEGSIDTIEKIAGSAWLYY